MKKTYSALMQELEELKEDYLDESNDEERDLIASEMKAVINQLKISRDEYKNISTSELKEKLNNASTYEEFSNLKDIIKEKREYESNSAKINKLVENGVDFEEDNKKIAKPKFKKFKKVLLGISILAAGFGVTSCMLRKNRSNDSYEDKNPSVTTENTVNYPENEGPNGDIPTEDNQSSEYNDYNDNSYTSGTNSINSNNNSSNDSNRNNKNKDNKTNSNTYHNTTTTNNNNNNNNSNNNNSNNNNSDNSKKDTSTSKSTTETRTEIEKETTEKPPKVIESEENKPTPAPKDDTPYPGETDIIIDDDKNYPDKDMPIEDDDNDTIYYDKTTEKSGSSSTTESRKESTTEKTTEDMPIEDDEDDVIYYSSSNVLEKGKSLVKRLTM